MPGLWEGKSHAGAWRGSAPTARDAWCVAGTPTSGHRWVWGAGSGPSGFPGPNARHHGSAPKSRTESPHRVAGCPADPHPDIFPKGEKWQSVPRVTGFPGAALLCGLGSGCPGAGPADRPACALGTRSLGTEPLALRHGALIHRQGTRKRIRTTPASPPPPSRPLGPGARAAHPERELACGHRRLPAAHIQGQRTDGLATASFTLGTPKP